MNKGKLTWCALALGLIVFATPSIAANWIETAKSKSGDIYSIDVSSINMTGNLVKGWVYTQLELPMNAYDPTISKEVWSMKHFIAWNCAERTRAHIQMVHYSDRDAGIVIESHSYKNLEFVNVIPDSVDEYLFNGACYLGKVKANNKAKTIKG